jgi:hypothetical protein
MMMTTRMTMAAMTPPTMWYLTVPQGLSARLHLVQILQIHLTCVGVATREIIKVARSTIGSSEVDNS